MSIVRCCLGVFLLSISALSHAQGSSTGVVSGRIIDATTGLPLGGARVAVQGTPIEGYADTSGFYSLPNVATGDRSVEVSYVGYPATQYPVSVSAGNNTLNVQHGRDVVELDRMVISGSVVGTARALNQQRAATSLTNVVAADEIGNFPDQNAAESIQRVPGVSLYRDQGEGRYVVLRGLNYTYTSVKVNNSAFAGADLGERATALDVIPADALAAIEVTKVPTPDMDGEGLGGQVNIKTKSPFEFDGLAASVTAQGQYADQSGRFSQKFNGFVSQRFGDNGKFGLLVAPTWQVRKFGSHNFETGGAWVSPEDNGTGFYTAEAIEFRDYEIERERYGLTAAFEARPDETTRLYVNGGYNRFTDAESRHLTLFDFTEGDLAEATADSATYADLRRYGRRLRIREKDQEVTTVSAGFEKRPGAWTFDGLAAYTRGKEKRPEEVTARFRRNARDARIRYETEGTYGFSITQLEGASFADPASYDFQRLDLANESGAESETDLALNARWQFDGKRPGYVKFGGRYRTKEKDSESEVYELDGAPADFTFANLMEEPSSYPFLRVPRLSTQKVKGAFSSNRAAFTGERLFEDSEYDDFSINEDVVAAYLMGAMAFGKLNVVAGARVERTEFETTGRELDLVEQTSTASTTARSYTNWLPGVHFRYDASDKLVFRASVSSALARPAFGDTAYRSAVNSEDFEIRRGNPMLEPLESTNFDASVEYYLPSLGVISAAVFQKDIENFSYEYSEEEPILIGEDEYEVTTFGNGSDGKITGLELAYQQQLRMLPGPMSGLGLLGNITFLDSKANYPTRPGEDVTFIGQSDYTGNLGLTYERGGFFARLAMNFRSERLREDEPLGGNAMEDLWIDDFKQLDLTMRYRVSKNWEVFGEFLNLTDEPFRVFLKSDNGQGERLGQWEEYGWSANFGLRWNL